MGLSMDSQIGKGVAQGSSGRDTEDPQREQPRMSLTWAGAWLLFSALYRVIVSPTHRGWSVNVDE
jgi:hypothetical protein